MDEVNAARGNAPRKTLYVVSMNHFINDGSTFLVASLFPAMEIAFGFSTFSIGILVAVGYFINMAFQPVTGRLSQKYEAVILLPLGISLIAVSMLLFIVSGTFYTMLLSVVVMRFGSSFFHPVGALTVFRNYSGSALDSSMGFESSFGNLGVMTSFVLSAPMYLAMGWSGPFIIYGSIQVIIVAVTLLSLRTRRISGTIPVQEYSMADERKPDLPRSIEPGHHNTPGRFLLGLPLFFVIVAFISGGVNAIFGNFGNILLFNSGFRIDVSDYIIAAWVLSGFIGAISTGWLTRKLTRMRVMYLAYLVGGACTLLFAVFTGVTYLAVLPLLASGFTISMTYPATYSELSDFIGRRPVAGGQAYGILFSSQIAGASFLGFLSGYVSREFSLRLAFGIGGAMMLSAIIAVFLWSSFYRRSRIS